ncbi:MAG: type II toxin-antitoxin system VapC family toxin [Sphingomonadales bacterium]
MTIVVDCSVVVAWCFPDELSPLANRAFERMAKEQAIAPALLWYEIRNALHVGERRQRLSADRSDAFLERVDRLGISFEPQAASPPLMRLARRHSLSVYDACYLELALRTGALLSTLDRQLAVAARSEGVELTA